MKKIVFLLVIVLICSSVFFACGKTEVTDATEGASTADNGTDTPADGETKDITVGVSLPSLNSKFFEAELFAIEQYCKEKGIKCISVVADGDVVKQKSQIEDLISQGVNAMIIVQQDKDAIVSSLEDCKKAGVYTICMGRMPSDETNMDVAVLCDNYECARVDVDSMIAAAKEYGYESLKVIELVGKLSDQNAFERSDAFKKYAEESDFDIEVVAEVATEWNVDTAYARMTDTVNMTPDFNAVYIPADTYITPVMSVLQANNRWVKAGEEGYVIISSIDGNPLALDYINQGYVHCTANTDAFDFGRLSVQAAVDLVEGKQVEKTIAVPATALTADVIASAGDSIWGNVYKD